jgi:hypothetical protein
MISPDKGLYNYMTTQFPNLPLLIPFTPDGGGGAFFLDIPFLELIDGQMGYLWGQWQRSALRPPRNVVSVTLPIIYTDSVQIN